MYYFYLMICSFKSNLNDISGLAALWTLKAEVPSSITGTI